MVTYFKQQIQEDEVVLLSSYIWIPTIRPNMSKQLAMPQPKSESIFHLVITFNRDLLLRLACWVCVKWIEDDSLAFESCSPFAVWIIQYKSENLCSYTKYLTAPHPMILHGYHRLCLRVVLHELFKLILRRISAPSTGLMNFFAEVRHRNDAYHRLIQDHCITVQVQEYCGRLWFISDVCCSRSIKRVILDVHF